MILYNFYRFCTLFIDFLQFLCYNFTENPFFLKKRALRENAYTAKYFYVFFSKKKPLRENAHTAKIFLMILEDSKNSKRFYTIFLSILNNFELILYNLYRFYTICINFIQFLLILNNFDITII